MTPDRLSPRLQEVAAMVTVGNQVYDIGCDHAYLSLSLMSEGRARSVIASDINPGPLMAAKRNIEAYGFEDRITAYLSDGILGLPDPEPPATLVIAGMGGPLILDILDKGRDRIGLFDEIIISPQSLIDYVRLGLPGLGLYITDESIVREGDRYYIVMKLGNTPISYDFSVPELNRSEMRYIIDKYGPVLIEKHTEVFRDYLVHEKDRLERIIRDLDKPEHRHKHGDELQTASGDLRLVKLLTGGLYGYDQNQQ